MSERERPSRHGLILGEALAEIAAAGQSDDAPEMCATCAFRKGCMTNQMAATGVIALNCLLGIDSDAFACHHGMSEGQPTKLCTGYLAAQKAAWSVVQAAVERLTERLGNMTGSDEIRAEFDAWIAEIDPDGTMDDYQRSRAYSRRIVSEGVRGGG